MAVADTHAHDEHHDDHHDHGEFIAHHFDSPQQQFDSGKLGIWLFLVTEVLFFSGLFVAYTLYRNHHPEIFDQAHIYLDKWLGCLNTIVLLFSSLTMALGVRAAQLGRNKNCAVYTLITMICAAVFLGVKAVEYSHKWDMGILVRSAFNMTGGHHSPETGIGQALGISDYLVYLSVIPAILLVLFIILAVVMAGKKQLSMFMAGLALTVGGYFLGAAGGHVYMLATAGGAGGSHASLQTEASPLLLYAQETETEQAEHAEGETHSETDKTDGHAADGEHSHAADDGHSHEGEAHAEGDHAHGDEHQEEVPDFDPNVGIFFSIYYCMTGLHAIHIIAGIMALAWVYYRSLLGHWRSDYFGPVDYVGLYWHLVDLIWIYLFPLLYLID